MLWKNEELENELHRNNLEIFSRKNLSNGIQLIMRGGSLINIYNTGTVHIQGNKADSLEKEIINHICNRENTTPKVYVFLGTEEAENSALHEKLTMAGISYKATKNLFLSQ
ncbi:hypothetical protein [Aquitalea denitrificans]|uniref:hypothetical protein n=1 Tax=Aquitalea denitrificans TaxID=519081 RepID=UPI00135BB24A|nr:hypothetical protein [Aquitalea denitrificans]